jgi:hypothetical protein
MRKKSLVLCFSVAIVAALLFGCVGMEVKPTEKNFKAPVVTLDTMEVAHAFGYWYFSKKVKPTKGKPDNVGAPLDLAFTFNIENPNEFPVMMEKLQFDIAFEDFVLNTVNTTATQWIPAGKTNQVRVHAHFDVRQSLLSLLVTGGFQLKKKGVSFWDQMEKWWTEAPNFSYPVNVNEGSAIFKADSVTRVVPFNATFP